MLCQIDQRISQIKGHPVFGGPPGLYFQEDRLRIPAFADPHSKLRGGGEVDVLAAHRVEALLEDVGVRPAPGSVIEYRGGRCRLVVYPVGE